MRPVLCVGLTIALASMLLTPARAQTLNELLYAIDQMRDFKNTPFAQVEAQAQTLLAAYPDPADRASIYYTVASVYAQSGQVHPAKTAAYAEKAMALPLDDVRKLQLAIYWGDAIQVRHRGVRGDELAQARRRAVEPYLDGLKLAVDQDLPDEAPDLPMIERFEYTGPRNDPVYQQMLQKRQAQIQARQMAQFQRQMIQHREVLKDQIVYLYTRFPFQTEELRQLLQDRLQDHPQVIADMVSRVERITAERMAKRVDPQIKQSIQTIQSTPPASDVAAPIASLGRVPTADRVAVLAVAKPGSADARAQRHPPALASQTDMDSDKTWPVVSGSLAGVAAAAGALVAMALSRRRRQSQQANPTDRTGGMP
jgi:hypothetical protein